MEFEEENHLGKKRGGREDCIGTALEKEENGDLIGFRQKEREWNTLNGTLELGERSTFSVLKSLAFAPR